MKREKTDYDLPAFALSQAISSAFAARELTRAFDVLVKAYFDEYTDATALDDEATTALSYWFDLAFPAGEDDDNRTFDQMVAANCPRNPEPL